MVHLKVWAYGETKETRYGSWPKAILALTTATDDQDLLLMFDKDPIVGTVSGLITSEFGTRVGSFIIGEV